MTERIRRGGNSEDFQLAFLGDVDASSGAGLSDGDGLVWDEASEKFKPVDVASADDVSTAVTTHNDSVTAHTAVSHVWTAGQTFQAATTFGVETPGATNDVITVPTGQTGVYWAFSAISSVTSYTHSVMTWGYNVNTAAHPRNTAVPTVEWTIEGRYLNGATYQSEVYLQYTPKAGAGASFRPMSFTIEEESPHATVIDFPALINVDGIWCDGNFVNTAGDTMTLYGPLWFNETPTSTLPLIHILYNGDAEFFDMKRTSTFRMWFKLDDSAHAGIIGVTGSANKLRFDVNGNERASIDQNGLMLIQYPNKLVLDGSPLEVKSAGIFGATANVLKFWYPGYETYANYIKNSVTLGAGHENVVEFALCSGNGTTVTAMKIYGEKHVALGATNAAIADADLFASSIAFHVDESGNNLIVRVKYADGTTLKTGTLALT